VIATSCSTAPGLTAGSGREPRTEKVAGDLLSPLRFATSYLKRTSSKLGGNARSFRVPINLRQKIRRSRAAKNSGIRTVPAIVSTN